MTSTALLMSVRFLFIGAASIHFIAGVWYAAACSNKALLDKRQDKICDSESWAAHQSKLIVILVLKCSIIGPCYRYRLEPGI